MKPSPRQMSALVTVVLLPFFLSACGSGAPEAVNVPTSTISSEAPAKGSVALEDSLEAEQAGEEVEALGSFPGGEIKEVTDANFAKEVLTSDKPVLVYFWDKGCGPTGMNATCKETGQILQAVADRQPPLIIVKMNVDENPSTWRTYNIRSIPTLIVYQGGQIKKTITGKIEHHMYELEPYL